MKSSTTLVLSFLVFIAVAIIGWVMNIVAIINTDSASGFGMLIARVIGVFIVPLGSILGFC